MTGIGSLWRCLRDRRGATAIEYALLAALIAGVLVVAIGETGQALSDLLADSNTSISAEISKSSGP